MCNPHVSLIRSDTLQFAASCFYTIDAELRRTRQLRESNSPVPRAVAPGAFLYTLCSLLKGYLMADYSTPIHFEDIPLDEARRMGRGPRMNPELYRALQQKLQLLGNTATRITTNDGTSPATMKNRILRVAAEVGVTVTIRKVPGGLMFWRSTDEDIQQAKDVAGRLRTTRQKGNSRNGRRRQRAAR